VANEVTAMPGQPHPGNSEVFRVKEAAMGSCSYKQLFTPEDLRHLDLALESALATARELGLPCSGLEGALRRRPFGVASRGITDPEALRNEALKEMNIDRIST